MKIFFDGGYRGGTSELAIVVRGKVHVEQATGADSSMAAEWLALIAALRLAVTLDLDDVVLIGDAAAVIAQAAGRVRVPPSCRLLAQAYAGLPRPSGRLRLRHVRRGHNLAGIALGLVGIHRELMTAAVR